MKPLENEMIIVLTEEQTIDVNDIQNKYPGIPVDLIVELVRYKSEVKKVNELQLSVYNKFKDIKMNDDVRSELESDLFSLDEEKDCSDKFNTILRRLDCADLSKSPRWYVGLELEEKSLKEKSIVEADELVSNPAKNTYKDNFLIRAIGIFKDGFYKSDTDEFIAITEINTYFSLHDVKDERDFKMKLISYVSRPCYKGEYHSSTRKNEAIYNRTLKQFNEYLGTSFNVEDINIIYTLLGNQCNSELCYEFIDSNYDMSLLKDGKR